jgi:hypothetical protein
MLRLRVDEPLRHVEVSAVSDRADRDEAAVLERQARRDREAEAPRAELLRQGLVADRQPELLRLDEEQLALDEAVHRLLGDVDLLGRVVVHHPSHQPHRGPVMGRLDAVAEHLGRAGGVGLDGLAARRPEARDEHDRDADDGEAAEERGDSIVHGAPLPLFRPRGRE